MATKSKMKCNVVTRSDRAGKKKMVKACANGKEKLIHFGAKGYGHNYSSAARKSFRARHKCATAKDKMTARYWACKNYGAAPESPRLPLLKSGKENISIFEAKPFYYEKARLQFSTR